MKHLIYLLTFSVLLSACTSDFEYRDVSRYPIDTTTLKDGDTIRIIYSSGGPNDNKKRTYFYHIIAVNENKQEDTVNLLVPDISNLNKDDHIKIYASQQSDAYQLLSAGSDFEGIEDGKDLESIKPAEINRVVVNTKFGEVDEKHYPVMIGMLMDSVSHMTEEEMNVLKEY